MPLSKPSRGEHDAIRTSKPTGQQHLYLIFDDWPWGYSIRKLKLPPLSPHQQSLRPLEQRRLRRLEPGRPEHKRLPPPYIRLEATRGCPEFFVAVGTKILATYARYDFGDTVPGGMGDTVPGGIVPIIDVRSRAVRFGPKLLNPVYPIHIPIGDEKLFALDMGTFKMLSMKPLCPPWMDCEYCGENNEWSCRDLRMPPFMSMDVASYAVDSDGQTILASTDRYTFAYNIDNNEWEKSSNCSLPFAGPAYYVHALDIFVGLSKGPDTYGRLCFCRELGGDENVRLSKEYLFSKNPAESHVGVKLVYLGGSEPGFCLVECVSITEGKSGNMRLEKCDQLVKCVDQGGNNREELDQLKNVDEGTGASSYCGKLDQLKKNVDEGGGASGNCEELDQLKKNVDEGDGALGSMHHRYLYHLTTFSLSFDNNGDLTTGETCVVQCYKVPKEVSGAIYRENPVAFWL